MNDHPVLAQKVPPKTSAQPVVCAGRVPPTLSASSQGSEDPWLQTDPWKQYLQKTRPETAPAAAVRQLAAPTVEKFQEQDQRILAIEATLKEVQQSQANIKQENQQLRKDVQVEVAAVRSDLGTFTSEIDRQMKANAEAMSQAHALQQRQMNAGFAELRALLEAQARNSWFQT